MGVCDGGVNKGFYVKYLNLKQSVFVFPPIYISVCVRVCVCYIKPTELGAWVLAVSCWFGHPAIPLCQCGHSGVQLVDGSHTHTQSRTLTRMCTKNPAQAISKHVYRQIKSHCGYMHQQTHRKTSKQSLRTHTHARTHAQRSCAFRRSLFYYRIYEVLLSTPETQINSF